MNVYDLPNGSIVIVIDYPVTDYLWVPPKKYSTIMIHGRGAGGGGGAGCGGASGTIKGGGGSGSCGSLATMIIPNIGLDGGLTFTVGAGGDGGTGGSTEGGAGTAGSNTCVGLFGSSNPNNGRDWNSIIFGVAGGNGGGGGTTAAGGTAGTAAAGDNSETNNPFWPPFFTTRQNTIEVLVGLVGGYGVTGTSSTGVSSMFTLRCQSGSGAGVPSGAYVPYSGGQGNGLNSRAPGGTGAAGGGNPGSPGYHELLLSNGCYTFLASGAGGGGNADTGVGGAGGSASLVLGGGGGGAGATGGNGGRGGNGLLIVTAW